MHIENELKICARGLTPTGNPHNVHHTPHAQDFFQIGPYDAYETARLAVRDAWIINQTEFESSEKTILDLQRQENDIKTEFIFSGGEREPKAVSRQRVSLLEQLYDEPAYAITEQVDRVFRDVSERYEDWLEEAEDYDGDEEDDVAVLADVRPFVSTFYILLCETVLIFIVD